MKDISHCSIRMCTRHNWRRPQVRARETAAHTRFAFPFHDRWILSLDDCVHCAVEYEM